MSVALVTGANGFIGSNLTKKLLENGWIVKGMVLPGTSITFIDNLDIEIVSGNITEPDSLIKASKNTDVIFHLAALAKDWGNPELFFKINAEGTKNLLEAAVRNNISRFVLMSSVAVHNYSGHYRSTEDTPRDCRLDFPYGLSKIKAEDYVTDFYEKKLIESVIIRPGLFPFGPNDITSFCKLANALKHGLFSYINGGNTVISTAYVENLCYGIELAGTKKQASGKTYLITDNIEISWKNLIEKFCKELEIKPPFLSIPYFSGTAIALILEKFWSILKISGEPPITKYRVSLMYKDLFFASEKVTD